MTTNKEMIMSTGTYQRGEAFSSMSMAEEVGLRRQSVASTLSTMVTDGQVEVANRDNRRITERVLYVKPHFARGQLLRASWRDHSDGDLGLPRVNVWAR